MAEFLFKDYVNKTGTAKKFHIESRATSSEEIGNPIHYGTAKILKRLNIDFSCKRAERISEEDYKKYDYIIVMEEYNRYNIERRIPDRDNKIHTLLEYTSLKRDISDPWYTGDFESTYNDIMIGLEGFYNYLKNKVLI